MRLYIESRPTIHQRSVTHDFLRYNKYYYLLTYLLTHLLTSIEESWQEMLRNWTSYVLGNIVRIMVRFLLLPTTLAGKVTQSLSSVCPSFCFHSIF